MADKVKATRTPKSAESIAKGALKLQFSERVTLRDELTKSIDKEIEEMESLLKKSKELVNGQA